MADLTALVLHEDCSLHDTGWQHPEHQGRLPAIVKALYNETPALQDLVLQRAGVPITEEDILLVHNDAHLARLRQAAEAAQLKQAIVPLDDETLVSPASWDAMLAAAGCVITACDAVLQGDARNGFALARPPGHHATALQSMGFCLINNVAIAARKLQQRGIGNILIIDWDVHHGNGTQDIFYDDASVYYLSTHQYPWYPYTGSPDERGGPNAPSRNLNIALEAGTTGERFLELYGGALDTVLTEFEPDFVLVSAGFDCLHGDPLGQLGLEPAHLHAATRLLMDRVPHGRIVHTLEGGYNPKRVGDGVVDVVRALADLPPHA
jgi:acetoin utilization deacetylase AcuC-like enzyme